MVGLCLVVGEWRVENGEWRIGSANRSTRYSPFATRLSRERHRLPGRRLAFEPARGRQRQLRELLAGVIADHQRALIERPAPAGEEVARAAALLADAACR